MASITREASTAAREAEPPETFLVMTASSVIRKRLGVKKKVSEIF